MASKMLCADAEIELTESSQIMSKYTLENKFKINTDSYAHGNDIDADPTTPGHLRCYTDGSRMNKKTGLGYCTLNEQRISVVLNASGMASHNTVHQAETKAIELASISLLQYVRSMDTKPPKIDFLCDSRSTLASLDKIKTDCQLTLDAKNALNDLCDHTHVELHWVKAHVNHYGNEKADELAKLGSKEPYSVGAPASKQAKKTMIKQATMKKWNAQ
jgi:ribonuclease HI